MTKALAFMSDKWKRDKTRLKSVSMALKALENCFVYGFLAGMQSHSNPICLPAGNTTADLGE